MKKYIPICLCVITLQFVAIPVFAGLPLQMSKNGLSIKVIDNDSITPIDYLIINQIKKQLRNNDYHHEWKKYSDEFWLDNRRLEICFLYIEGVNPSILPARGWSRLSAGFPPLLLKTFHEDLGTRRQ